MLQRIPLGVIILLTIIIPRSIRALHASSLPNNHSIPNACIMEHAEQADQLLITLLIQYTPLTAG